MKKFVTILLIAVVSISFHSCGWDWEKEHNDFSREKLIGGWQIDSDGNSEKNYMSSYGIIPKYIIFARSGVCSIEYAIGRETYHYVSDFLYTCSNGEISIYYNGKRALSFSVKNFLSPTLTLKGRSSETYTWNKKQMEGMTYFDNYFFPSTLVGSWQMDNNEQAYLNGMGFIPKNITFYEPPMDEYGECKIFYTEGASGKLKSKTYYYNFRNNGLNIYDTSAQIGPTYFFGYISQGNNKIVLQDSFGTYEWKKK
jgi:hypothetical protein